MLRQKGQEKIVSDLINLVKNTLQEGYKNRKGQRVEKVEKINILEYKIDEENDDRDKVIITKVQSVARVIVRFGHDATTNDEISLRNDKVIEFVYNKEIDNFEIQNDSSEFYNNSAH